MHSNQTRSTEENKTLGMSFLHSDMEASDIMLLVLDVGEMEPDGIAQIHAQRANQCPECDRVAQLNHWETTLSLAGALLLFFSCSVVRVFASVSLLLALLY